MDQHELPGFDLAPAEPGVAPAGPGAAARDVTWTVAQVNEWASISVESAFGGMIWVEGEICNLNRSAKGHVYFTLIEPGEDRRSPSTQLPVTLFEWNKQKVNLQIRRSGGGIRVEDGVKVRLRGSVSLYRQRSQLQLNMVAIDPAYTLGTLAADRDALMAALAAEGLLGANALVAVPMAPLRVGLITSLGSAAHADFLHELEVSGIGFGIVQSDARVQGIEAEETVVAALAAITAAGVDVVCIVRGGGARTDLAAFDTPAIARAVAASPTPVWVGIGHEIDRTVTDDVAHSSFKTPTACAAALVRAVRDAEHEAEMRFAAIVDRVRVAIEADAADLDLVASHAATATRSGLARGEHRLDLAATRVAATSGQRLRDAETRLAAVGARVALDARRRTDAATQQLQRTVTELRARPPRQLGSAERAVDAAAAQIRAYDPGRALARGWSITRRADGSLLRSATDATPGETIVTQVADGSIASTIERNEMHDVHDMTETTRRDADG